MERREREQQGGGQGEGPFDFLQKIIIIGDSGVGKSNLLLRYASDCFVQNHMATIGLNYVFKIESFDDINVKLQIWDTAGQDKFRTITKSYYRNSQGVLVVFALDDKDSFRSVEKWMDDLAETTNEKTCVLLLGNKNDLHAERQVSPEEARLLASTYGVEYLECSAKAGLNVDQAFQKLGRHMKTTFIDSYDAVKDKQKVSKVQITRTHWREKCCQK